MLIVLFIAIVLFRELNCFLEIVVCNPQKILRVSQKSKLNRRNSILDPRKEKVET